MIDYTIQDLYEVFNKYPANKQMAGSPIYGEKVKKWNKDLFSKSLTELTSDDLARFCSSVTLTWGTIEDYKHFLPRIYELIADGDFLAEEWVVFDVLNRYDWQYWPDKEFIVLNRYFLDLWRSIIKDPREEKDYLVGEYLPPIANVYSDFMELLSIWGDDDSKPAIRKIVFFFTWSYNDIFIKVRLPGFKKSKGRGEQIFEWITSPKMKKKLNNARATYKNEEFNTELGWLVDSINMIN
jgi:hypothetical protein